MNHANEEPLVDREEPFDADTEAFATRIALSLRAPEHLNATFEDRVMEHVYALANHIPRGWWRRERTLRITPLSGAIVAAGFAIAIVLGTLGVWNWRASDTNVSARPHVSQDVPQDIAQGGSAPIVLPNRQGSDTVHIVRFVLLAPGASQVSIVGDFNNWNKDVSPLERKTSSGGAWVTSLQLPVGRHEYAFIVKRATEEHWVLDPSASVSRDDFDTESSVILVGDVSRTSETTL